MKLGRRRLVALTLPLTAAACSGTDPVLFAEGASHYGDQTCRCIPE